VRGNNGARGLRRAERPRRPAASAPTSAGRICRLSVVARPDPGPRRTLGGPRAHATAPGRATAGRVVVAYGRGRHAV